MSELVFADAKQQYVFNVSNGEVTEPVGGSWLSAYAIYLGATEPKGTWLQTICHQLGITEPVNGSWVQALAFFYGITESIGGNWWIALALEATSADDWMLSTGIWKNGNTIWTSDGIWKTV